MFAVFGIGEYFEFCQMSSMVDFFVANQLNEIRIDIFTWVRNFTWPLSV